jgi:hypothetical protein
MWIRPSGGPAILRELWKPNLTKNLNRTKIRFVGELIHRLKGWGEELSSTSRLQEFVALKTRKST